MTHDPHDDLYEPPRGWTLELVLSLLLLFVVYVAAAWLDDIAERL